MSAYAVIRVEPDGGEPYEVEVISRDILMWERTTHGAAVSKLTEEQHITDMYKLAYFAAKRLGKFAGTQAEFEASCDIESRAPEVEPDPTNPAP